MIWVWCRWAQGFIQLLFAFFESIISFIRSQSFFSQLLSAFVPPEGVFPVPHWSAVTDREDRMTVEDGLNRRDFWGTVSVAQYS
mmetsp:Transcript_16856/g.35622  ORF Transcript_16856/g.35622 Transcript_16856/m.35622 type:complete len:84 (-) Transcript_16856:385-636(-)